MKSESIDCKQIRLNYALEKSRNVELSSGIGTLSEKILHRTLKNYIEEDNMYHEQRIHEFTVDILKDGQIFEIQTKSFRNMKNKLVKLLDDYKITIVHPIIRCNYINWIDPLTGERISRRKSTKTGKIMDVFEELYQIKTLIAHPNLFIHVVLLDVEEYKILDGYGRDKKKRATKIEKVPTVLIEEIEISTLEELKKIIPDIKLKEFTVKEFAKACKISTKTAQMSLNVMFSIGLASRIRKEKNAYVYQIK